MINPDDYDVITGPVATKDPSGVYTRDYTFPDQYKFSIDASVSLQEVAVFPAVSS